ncbi:MAG: DbpA RNA binding domain-containing protein, partial [Rhodomicrobium sp.]
TGRAGRAGVSVIITPHSKRRGIERLLTLAGIRATWVQVPSAETILQRDRERLLSDPVLEAPLNDEELAFAKDLLATKSPEQVAAAFFRQNKTHRPTPEEFVDTGEDASEVGTPLSDFDGGVWFRLSVGRKQRAEPRWILPLICKAGGVTKRDIGAIKIFETESLVEVSARSAQSFSRSLAKSGRREDSITITRMNGRPEPGAELADTGAKKGSRKMPGMRRKKAPPSSLSARKS